jgi:septation ring formation regulator EzrA
MDLPDRTPLETIETTLAALRKDHAAVATDLAVLQQRVPGSGASIKKDQAGALEAGFQADQGALEARLHGIGTALLRLEAEFDQIDQALERARLRQEEERLADMDRKAEEEARARQALADARAEEHRKRDPCLDMESPAAHRAHAH